VRLGVFGGSFDPIHEGHLAMARGARDAARLDRMMLVVAKVPPHKGATVASADDRLAMARLAVEGENGLEASDLELRREGPSYTIDTVRELQRHDPRAAIALLIGSDSLADLPKWKEARALLEEATPLIAPRRDADRGELQALRPSLGDVAVDRLERGWLDLPLRDVSSTEVRQRLAIGADASGLLPPAVLRYIRDHGLYRSPGGP
jgi:nicotinate-nucleotide adenylyltransferase